MKNISLSEKLILYFLSLGIGAIAIISIFAFFSTKDALMNRTFDQLVSLRTVKKHQLELFFTDRMRDLTFLAASEETRKITEELNSRHIKADDQRVAGERTLSYFTSWLKKYRNLSNYFSDINLKGSGSSVLSGNIESGSVMVAGPVTAASGIAALESRIRREKLVIGDMQRTEMNEEPYLLVGTVIPGKNMNDPEPGILILKIPGRAINAIMLNNNPESGLGKTGETYLVGKDYVMRSSSRLIPNSILETRVHTQSVINALAGRVGFLVTRDYRNIPVLSTYTKTDIPCLDWILIAEIDQEEAMIPIFRMRNSIMFLSIFISLIFFVFVFLIARKITRPIIHLKDAALQVGKGEYDIQLPVQTNDEIGSLTEAFNTMTLHIHEKTRELQYERLERMRSVIDGEENERQRLSRELHDGIGQSLVALKLRLESLLYIDETKIRENIILLKDQFDGTVDEIRRISNNLMPSVLKVFGIKIALKNLCTETDENSGMKVTFECHGDIDVVHTKLKTYIYRISQEALNNIIKHSSATEIELRLNRDKDYLTLFIADNGKGFVLEEAAMERGNGLYNMRERVTLLHGTFSINSTLDQGTKIIVKLPIF